MKKYCYTYILIFTLCIQYTVVGQTVLQKNTPEGGDLENVASEEVQLTPPNYQYIPTNQNEQMHAYIDKTKNIGPASYGSLLSDNDFNNLQIDENLAVGMTPGEAGVSNTGAATYSIPLKLPLGTNGMEPEISINYNSQAGNGILGYGWNISGLSMIMRGGKNIYANDEAEGIQMDNTDNLYLDGNRLIELSPGEYRTESEAFDRIIPHSTIGNGPDWFEVQTKNGLTIELGKVGYGAKRFGTGPNGVVSVLFWRVNKIYDNYGNFIEYYYKDDGGENRIDKILYTGNHNTGLHPYNALYFHYKERKDVNENYIENAQTAIATKYLLDKIEIKTVDYHDFRTYQFSYGYDLYSYLIKVQEIGDNGVSFNPVVFKYGEKSGVSYTPSSFNFQQGTDIITGDYNGDGLTDIISADFFYNPNNNYTKTHTDANLYINNNGTFSNTPDWQNPTIGGFSEIIIPGFNLNSNSLNSSFLQFMASDYNGDGMEDFIVVNRNIGGPQNSINLEDIIIFTSNGNGFTQQTISNPNNYDRLHPDYNQFYVGDFDGNGASDYLIFISNGTSYKCFITFPGDGSASYNNEVNELQSGFNASVLVSSDIIYVVDFDGDGKSDLMTIDDQSAKIWSFKRNGNSSITPNKIYESGFPTRFHNIYPGDFNGDGKTDFLSSGDGVNWQISYSTGTGFNSVSFIFDVFFQINSHDLSISDFNGDGKADILHARNNFNSNSATTATIDIYESNGIGFELTSQNISTVLGFTLLKGDFSGDGKMDAINRFPSNGYDISLNKDDKDLHLEKIVDSYLNKHEFNYKPLTDQTVYVKGNNSSFPLYDFQAGLQVVDDMKYNDGVGGQVEVDYKYAEAIIHRQGKGFLGFKEIQNKDNVNNIKVIQKNTVDNNFFVLYPDAEEKYLSLDNNPQNDEIISEVQYDFEFISLGQKRFWLRKNQAINNKYFQTFSTTSNFTYDNFGNLLEKEELYTYFLGNIPDPADNTGNKIQSITKTIDYGQFGSWIPSSPISNTVTTVRQGQDPYTRSSVINYNNKGYVTSEVSDPSDSKSVTESILYDDYGNKIKTTISAAGVQSRFTEQKMDALGRFPISTKNSLGQISTLTYNQQWGKVAESVGIDGLKDTYVYDNMGKLKQSTNPQGVNTSVNFSWDIGNGSGSSNTSVDNGIYKVVRSANGEPDFTTWFDRFNRERQIEVEGYNQVNRQVTSYDERGNVKTTTTPFSMASQIQPVITTSTYDDYNVLIEESNSAGSTSINYSLNLGIMTTITTAPDGKVTSSKTETLSRMPVQSNDNGGTIKYTYFSSDQIRSIDYNGQTVAEMEYDLQNNKTELTELNAGTSTYDYNAYGEMISQTDGNGSNYQRSFDVLGRMIEETGPDGTTSYEYVESGNGLNSVETITGFNGHNVLYDYDQFNRVTKVVEEIQGEVFSKGFTYNSNDQITTMTYPSGFKISRTYNSEGYLESITSDNGQVSYFTLNEMDAFENFSDYTLGNGITTEKTCDEFGLPTFIGDGVIQSLEMEFDPQNGNMNYRKNLLNGVEEVFVYDNLNRLEESDVNVPLQSPFAPDNNILLTYDNNGNITYKSGVGEYTYSTSKPNALESITNIEDMGTPDDQFVQYTPFNSIANVTEGAYYQELVYGFDEQRRKSLIYNNNALEKTITYVGNYERIETGTNTYDVHYISSGEYLIAINVRTNNGTDEIYYTYTDHLGSILTLTDENANVVHEQNFDPWGVRRNAQDWSYDNISVSPPWLIRGYTFHEHMDEFNLINMNGRVYDPVVGRMLSPDNLVQMPGYTQNYNRYSYVLNNPLAYTDPTGEAIDPATALIITKVVITALGTSYGAYVGGSIANNSFSIKNWDKSSWKTWVGVGLGGVLGGVGAYFGVATGATLSSTGKVVLAQASKKGLSVAFAGNLNAMYNYEKGQSAWESIGYAAAGSLGAYTGIAGTTFQGLLVGGALNTSTYAISKGLIGGQQLDGYKALQKFVGGALSSYAGSVAFDPSKAYLKIGKKYLGGNKMVSKALSYGIQSSASDFAYTDQKYYMKKSFLQHTNIFVTGLFTGIIQSRAGSDYLFKQPLKKEMNERMIRTGISLGGYSYDYLMTTYYQGYNPFDYKKGWNKISIGTYKSLFYNLILR